MSAKTPKKPTTLFDALEIINRRPAPFEFYTAEQLWDDDHISKQLLEFHLDENLNASPKKAKALDLSVKWICSHFKINKTSSIINFGCGPGLYASRFAKRQASVTGIDCSSRAIAFARDAAQLHHLEISYIQQNYLDFTTDQKFELITMLMCDFCTLSPAQRAILLNKFFTMLSPHGSVLLDLYSTSEFERKQESTTYEVNLLNGLWSAESYHGILTTFVYPEQKVVLDKYTIIEKTRVRQFYNWLQYFTPSSINTEFEAAGFTITEVHSDLTGTDYRPEFCEFVVVAQKKKQADN